MVLAKCKSNLGSSLIPELRKLIIHDKTPEEYKFYIEIGKVYPVLALSITGGYTYLGIWSDEELGFQLLPADFFEIIDSRLSQLWRITYEKSYIYESAFTFFGHPETVNNREHINGLIEGVKEDIAVLNKYKELLEMEFDNPSVSLIAEPLDNGWLLCPSCCDAWKSESQLELVKCPSCSALMKNII